MGSPPAGQPSLRAQLSPLTLEQMEERLHATFGVAPRRPSPQEEAVMGFKKRRKEELLDALVAAYGAAAHGAGTPQAVRRYRRVAGGSAGACSARQGGVRGVSRVHVEFTCLRAVQACTLTRPRRLRCWRR